jgi:hypothetical protein
MFQSPLPMSPLKIQIAHLGSMSQLTEEAGFND